MSIQEVANAAYMASNLPKGVEPMLEATTFYDPENFVFPFGTHVCVVEIDRETGKPHILRYVAVDDCGPPQINPMIVEGQVHGGGSRRDWPRPCTSSLYMIRTGTCSPPVSWSTWCRVPWNCPT